MKMLIMRKFSWSFGLNVSHRWGSRMVTGQVWSSQTISEFCNFKLKGILNAQKMASEEFNVHSKNYKQTQAPDPRMLTFYWKMWREKKWRKGEHPMTCSYLLAWCDTKLKVPRCCGWILVLNIIRLCCVGPFPQNVHSVTPGGNRCTPLNLTFLQDV